MKKLSVLLLILCSAACVKNPRDNPNFLPPATDTGAHTFGCTINGKIYKPVSNKLFSATRALSYNGDHDGFVLIATNNELRKQMIIRVNTALDKDTALQFAFPEVATAEYCMDYGRGATYTTYSYSAGEIRISSVRKGRCAVAGTFWFDAVDTLTRDTIRVRDGRFDIRN